MVSLFRHLSLAMAVFLTAGCAFEPRWYSLQHNLFKLGDLYVTLNDFDNAEAAYTKGLKVLERIPPGYLEHALMYIEPSRYLEDKFAHVGDFYYKQGKLDPARACFTRTLSIGETSSKEDASDEEHSKAIQHYKDTLQQIEAQSGK